MHFPFRIIQNPEYLQIAVLDDADYRIKTPLCCAVLDWAASHSLNDLRSAPPASTLRGTLTAFLLPAYDPLSCVILRECVVVVWLSVLSHLTCYLQGLHGAVSALRS